MVYIDIEAKTYIENFIDTKVCPNCKGTTGYLKLPFVAAYSFFISPVPLFLVGLLTFIFFFLVPLNANLNCSVVEKKKDGTKSLVVSFIIVYVVMFSASLFAKVFICNKEEAAAAVKAAVGPTIPSLGPSVGPSVVNPTIAAAMISKPPCTPCGTAVPKPNGIFDNFVAMLKKAEF